MEPDEDNYLADVPFFTLVGLGDLWPPSSLEHVSGERLRREGHETDMIRRVEEAWRTPFRDLTCEQARLLLSQKWGLEWLGPAIVEFVRRYPDAIVTNYAGEMGLLSLRAADPLLAAAGPAFIAWLDEDFGWMDYVFGWNRELTREARLALASACLLAASR